MRQWTGKSVIVNFVNERLTSLNFIAFVTMIVEVFVAVQSEKYEIYLVTIMLDAM